MGKALMYMALGAVTSGATYYYMNHKDEIQHMVKRCRRNGMRAMNRFKAMF